jgi:ribosomal protein uL13
MKIIDGKNAILGRIASYAAKQALQGEKIIILNCEQVLISGDRKKIKEEIEKKRRKGGSSQKGPKHSRLSEKIVKRTIRGMLPDHRQGRGREAYKNIKCYKGVPKEYENYEKTESKINLKKFVKVKDLE